MNNQHDTAAPLGHSRPPPTSIVDYAVVPEAVRRLVTTSYLAVLADTVPESPVSIAQYFRAAWPAQRVGMTEVEHFEATAWLAAFFAARPARLT